MSFVSAGQTFLPALLACVLAASPVHAQTPAVTAKAGELVPSAANDPRFPRTVTIYGPQDNPAAAKAAMPAAVPPGVARSAEQVVRKKGSPLALRALDTTTTVSNRGNR